MRTCLALHSPLLSVPRPSWQHVAGPWCVSGPGCFEVFSSLFGPVWGQKQGLLTLYLGVN